MWSIWTNRLSIMVFEILNFKDIRDTTLTFWGHYILQYSAKSIASEDQITAGIHQIRQSYRSGRPSHQMVTLWRNELHDRNSIVHVIVCQVAEQCIWRRHHGVPNVGMKLSFVQELNVVDTFWRIIWNVLRRPVEILGWTTSTDNSHWLNSLSNFLLLTRT